MYESLEPLDLTLSDLNSRKYFWEGILKDSEEHRDFLLDSMNMASQCDIFIRSKITVMLYNNNNHIEQCQEAILKLDKLIIQKLKE